jgi:hypothetical protein
MSMKKSNTPPKQKARMGRPPVIDAEKLITLRLPAQLLDAIDAWAADHMATRSEAIRKACERMFKTR